MLHLDKIILTCFLCGICGVLVIYYMSVYVVVSVVIVLLLVYAYYESLGNSRIHVHGLARPSPLRKLLINLRLQTNTALVSAMKTFRQLNPVPNNTNGVCAYQRRESASGTDNSSLNYTTYNSFTDLDKMENTDRKSEFSPFSMVSNGSLLSGHLSSNRNKRPQYNTPRRHTNASTNLSFSPTGSPWGTSVSPKLRSHGSGVKTVQTVAGPLLASTRYNINLNSGLYGDVNSPGFTSRVARYALDNLKSPTHQKQYSGPGQFPLVQLDRSGSKLPVVSTRRSQGIIHSPVMLDDVDDDDIVKRQKKGEGQNSVEQMTDDQPGECGTMGKRPREESPGEEETGSRLHMQVSKRTRNNEILSSLSSSRNILNQIKSNKRKSSAADWSRSSTPVIGKQLKSSQDVLREATSLLMMTKGTSSTNCTSIASPTTTTTITSSSTTTNITTTVPEKKELVTPEVIKPSEFLPKFAAVLDKTSGPVLNSVAALEAKRAHDSRTRLRSMLAVIAGEDDFLKQSETAVNDKKTEATITSLSAPTLSVTAPSTTSSPFMLPTSSTSIQVPSSGFSLSTPVTSSAAIASLSPSTSASLTPTLTLTSTVTTVTSAPFSLTSPTFPFGESKAEIPVSSSSLPTFGVSKVSDVNSVSTQAISSAPNLTTVSAATITQSSSPSNTSGAFSFSSEKTVIEAAKPAGTLESTTTLFTYNNPTTTSASISTPSSTTSGFGSTFTFGESGFGTQTSTAVTTPSATAPATLFGIPKSTEKETQSVTSTLFSVPKSNNSEAAGASNTLSVSVFGATKSSDKEISSISASTPTGLFGATKSNEQKETSVSSPAPLFASTLSGKESTNFSSATTVMFGSSVNNGKESTSITSPSPVGLFGTPKTTDKVEKDSSIPGQLSFFGVPKSDGKEAASISSPAPTVMFGAVKGDGRKEATSVPTSTPGSLFGAMKNNDKETLAPTGTFSFGAKPASGISSPFQLATQTSSPGGFKFNLDTTKDKKENQPSTSKPASTPSSTTSPSVASFQFGSSKPAFGFTSNGPTPNTGGFAFGSAQTEKPQQGMFSFGSTLNTTMTTTTTTTQTSTPGSFTFGATKPGGFAFNSSGSLPTQTTQANAGGGGFGTAATSTQPFGGSGTKSEETQSNSGLFGSTSTTPNLFGNTSQSSGTTLFGSSPAPALSGGLFSSTSSAPANNLFGSSNTKATQQTGLFGNTSGQSTPLFGNQTQTSSSLFGNSASSPSVFGTPTTQAPSSSTPAFGSTPQNSGGIFGTPSMPAFGSSSQSNVQPAGTLFGSGSTAQSTFSFGSASQQPSTSSGTGMFGAGTSASTSTGASTTPFQFGGGAGSSGTTTTPATGAGAGAAGSGAPFLKQNAGQNMFSIGSGSTAPRARSSRMRRQR
ncbi:hypothetical protein C0J52_10238 [Blattella germanica]|nr:hypothetical protein C0J52_10238 [Blattella germanica]